MASQVRLHLQKIARIARVVITVVKVAKLVTRILIEMQFRELVAELAAALISCLQVASVEIN